MKRRDFFVNAALMSGAVFAPFFFQNCSIENSEDTNIKAESDPDFNPDVEINLESVNTSFQILPGAPTEAFTYRGELVIGKPENLQGIEGSYLGPIITVKKGQKIRINYKNQLDQESIIHWHGLHIPEKSDGHPRFAIDKGETFVYEFEVKNRAGTYWFHPHPHEKTGSQVYNGLAGLFIVKDEEEEELLLPSGKYDIPIIIQDRIFDSNNQFDYKFNRMAGFLGDRILINGKINSELELSSRVYRFRLLNGSNSRIYKIAISDGSPLTVIGNDGGLLESPIIKNYIVLGPAERIDLIIDLSGKIEGDTFIFESLPFPDPNGEFGMMRGGGSVFGSQNGTQFDLFQIKITKTESVPFSLPDKLSTIRKFDQVEIVNAANPKKFVFSMRMMTWNINNKTFEMNETTSDEEVNIDNTEVWEFINGMGGGFGMPHPVHVHGLQFQIEEKKHEDSALWESLKDGFVDSGWRDTVLLLPGMSIKIILKFEDFKGLFLYHCHNLEHEDMGMMRNYRVI